MLTTTTKLTIPEDIANKPMVFLTVGQAFDFLDLYFESKEKVTSSSLLVVAPAPSTDEHLNYGQAVTFLKISRPTFGKLRRAGKIKGIQVSERRVLFNKSDLEAYLQSTHE